MTLHPDFLTRPIAHRGLHQPGIPENSLAAFRAAIDAGYAIECDIQPAADGTAMVFHDYDLKRLCGADGFVNQQSPEALAQTRLLDTDETIPTLAQILALVAGRTPLLIEIKDQDGRLGPDIGDLQDRVAALLVDYHGPVAVMSFNPHTTAAFHKAAPEIACGLTSCHFPADDWPMLGADQRARLADLADYTSSGSCFISHQHTDLTNPAVARIKAAGGVILCWTIRSPESEANARQIAQNITFEGYLA
ncbi:MAG: glycerophosphodiester phosphodiesterase family protein [Paracoccus sp. (in: a-proteobacteria)]|uniref:glycerophosphodiester phosphodiesterase family protein n=1 Tax=Paracoccus sp. TaxID=267 RepID=UPI0026E0DDF4|nr:glycerophosphodiester phosphodiesterase family protein [Paracoccus sp. (in: a-proteobacteria)]MDO5620200.1 glycerophosphodiester phosphodiesterase family protein [Paracoccus sp. (in: a-proteobacteria)]